MCRKYLESLQCYVQEVLRFPVAVFIRGRTNINTPSTSTGTSSEIHVLFLVLKYLLAHFHSILVFEERCVHFTQSVAQKHTATCCINILRTV